MGLRRVLIEDFKSILISSISNYFARKKKMILSGKKYYKEECDFNFFGRNFFV